jgi:predicted nucleic acid-binding protein
MLVVADTNILISALMFGGLPGALLDLALSRNVTLVT